MRLKQTVRIPDLYRGINEFKKGYWCRTIFAKDESDDLLTDSHSILKRQKNYFCQLLNVCGFNDFRQTEVQTAEPLVSKPSSFVVEIVVEKLKR
jgi:hypothetical protein